MEQYAQRNKKKKTFFYHVAFVKNANVDCHSFSLGYRGKFLHHKSEHTSKSVSLAIVLSDSWLAEMRCRNARLDHHVRFEPPQELFFFLECILRLYTHIYNIKGLQQAMFQDLPRTESYLRRHIKTPLLLSKKHLSYSPILTNLNRAFKSNILISLKISRFCLQPEMYSCLQRNIEETLPRFLPVPDVMVKHCWLEVSIHLF